MTPPATNLGCIARLNRVCRLLTETLSQEAQLYVGSKTAEVCTGGIAQRVGVYALQESWDLCLMYGHLSIVACVTPPSTDPIK